MVHLVDLQHVFIITARKRSLGQGNIFTNVCSSVQGEGVCIQEGGLHRGGWADPPQSDTMGYGQRSGGTHPTGMHSCSCNAKNYPWLIQVV